MAKLLIQRLAQDALESLFVRNRKEYEKIAKSLNELAEKGLRAVHIKKLKGAKNIFRKRTGRWRILFTVDGEIFKIWIIALEKGTRQDYFKWILYIEKSV